MSDRTRLFRTRFGLCLFVATLSLLLVGCGGSDSTNGNDDGNGSGSDDAPAAPANEAQAIFVEVGCAECHGDQGQGVEGEAGSLQGTRQIINQFQTRVRNGRGEAMPAYSEEEISDEEVELLYEWLTGE